MESAFCRLSIRNALKNYRQLSLNSYSARLLRRLTGTTVTTYDGG